MAPTSLLRYCIASVLCFMVVLATAQTFQYPPVNSGNLLSSAYKMEEEEKYDQVQALLRQVPANDTNYNEALYRRVYTYMLANHFDSCVALAAVAMELFPNDKQRLLHVASSAYDYHEQPEKAVALLDTLLAANPEYLPGRFSKSIILRKLKKNEEARRELQEIILRNPYYNSAHFSLGEMYYLEGNLVGAILAWQTYLILAGHDGRYVSNTIGYLDEIVKLPEEVRKRAASFRFIGVQAFNEIQQVLLSKAALNQKYKLQLSLNDNIVRQLQACNELLRYEASSKDFAMQYYVPFFETNFKEGHFETMVYDMLRGLKMDNVQSWLKKNNKKTEVYTQRVNEYLALIRISRMLPLQLRNQPNPCYLYENGLLVGKGPCADADLSRYSGHWQLYYSSGKVSSEGAFDDVKNKQGEWKYYYPNGVLKETSTFKDDELQGTTHVYFDNGHTSMEIPYTNGKKEGEERAYFYNGVLRRKVNYKDGNREGEQWLYNYKSQLMEIASYKADKLHGITRTFYPNGKVKDSLHYAEDIPQGTHFKYSNEGVLVEKGDYKDGKRHGEWLSWYPDGTTLREKTQYEMGDITGPFFEYHANGLLSRKGSYVKKKPDGTIEDYDDDGKVYAVLQMEKGKLKTIRHLDKQGKEISTTTTSRGAATITFFDPYGTKISEGAYNRDGEKDGAFTEYYPSGKVKETKTYKAGLLEGKLTRYYTNGQKEYEALYKKGEVSGYNIWYHTNGKVSSEGWYEDGTKAQFFSFYNEKGTLTDLEYYLNGEKAGPQMSFYPNGKIEILQEYKDGWVCKIEQYDSTGKQLAYYNLAQGKSDVKYFTHQGSTQVAYKIDRYEIQGDYMRYYPDGKVHSSQQLVYGDMHGSYYLLHPNGNKGLEVDYTFGEKNGRWTEYFMDGKLHEAEQFKDDERHGESKIYRNDGSLFKSEQWMDGERHGASTQYDEKGNPMLAILYKKGNVYAVASMYANGKLTDTVPVVKGSGLFTVKNAAGTTVATFALQDHKLQGKYVLSYASGKPMLTTQYDAGYQQGERLEYYPDGKVRSRETYEAGRRFGLFETYYPNGNKELTENLIAGHKHGVCTYYEPSGKVVVSYLYYNGLPERKID